MKIGVVGNCQSVDLIRCLQVMLPDVEVGGATYIQMREGAVKLPDVLAGCDLFFAQSPMKSEWSDVLENERRATQIVLYPSLAFNGFHPDIVRATHAGTRINSPIGNYNSAIALFAWTKGLSLGRTLELYREDIYESIGYFGSWDVAKRGLLASGQEFDLDLQDEFATLAQSGCFMHTDIHPRLAVIAGLARQLVGKLGLETVTNHPENYLQDTMFESIVWPVYPEIAARRGMKGEYIWKTTRAKSKSIGTHYGLMTLAQFVERCFALYAGIDPATVECLRFQNEAFRELGSVIDGKARRITSLNPYRNLPDHQFWRRGVASIKPDAVDPVVKPRFAISDQDRVATAGSCFAQHISRRLLASGYRYLVTEVGADLSPDLRSRRNFGVYSARYGNLYSTRQLVQLFDRAFGTFQPNDTAWRKADGRWVDPFRPEIDPDGFASAEDVVREREVHLSAVRTMFETLDVFVFTLGLTEAWRAKADGAVFPLAPGVTGGEVDPDAYEFVNLTAVEVEADLRTFIERLRRLNPAARILLTVSPVPLVATYEPRHVLVSTTASKSALHVAADRCRAEHPFVDYFPSYEIITGSFNRGAYYDDDLRTVTSSGVDHAMRVFMANYSKGARNAPSDSASPSSSEAELRETRQVVCEEERLDA